jgi:hypothetical protein
VLKERVRQGAQAGVVAWAATLGVLIGFGRSRGASLQPLNSIAHSLFGTRALLMQGFDWLVTPAALLLHLAALVAWAVLFALLAGRLRGVPLLAAAGAYALVVWLVNRIALPSGLVTGFVRVLSPWEIGAIYLVLALALAAGLRLGAPTPPTATARM